jgi:hypothetical protein
MILRVVPVSVFVIEERGLGQRLKTLLILNQKKLPSNLPAAVPLVG